MKPETNRAWSFRGGQLDLARQMETVEYICAFTDFIARQHCNVLVLYLEARIRTASFPWPADGDCYTPVQMREIVAHAARRGVEVVPVVSNLGHAEGFLRFPQLRPLAELRDGGPGRFQQQGSRRGPFSMFCTSLPGTWEFFENYYREVAELFPGRWFHAGCDEDWDFCCCPLCRRFARGEARQAALFARHLLKTHAIITGKLGKRLIIWDDMLEHYPSAVNQLPRDVVLATWLYDDVVDLPQGHFGNRPRADKFALYQARGLDYLIVPGAGISSLTNVTTLTAYAARHRPLGGFVSIWEKSRSFMFETYPALAYAGELWRPGGVGKSAGALSRSLARVFPSLDARQRATAVLPLSRSAGQQPATLMQQCLTGPLSALEYERRAVNRRLALDLAALRRGKHAPEESLVLEDLALRVDSETLAIRMRALATEIFQRQNGLAAGRLRDLRPEIRKCRNEVRRLAQARCRQWKAARPGLPAPHLDAYWHAVAAVVNQCERIATGRERTQTGIFRIECVLLNFHGAQRLAVAIRYRGSRRWIQVGSGVYKALPLNDGAFYEVWLPIAANRAVAGCRLESWGYGGLGLTYVEAINQCGRYVPGKVVASAGKVWDAGNLLTDDLQWCWLGEPDADVPFFDMARGRTKHTVELLLTPTRKDAANS